MTIYKSEKEYKRDLEKRALLPEGFKASSIPLGFIPQEKTVDTTLKMDLSLVMLDLPTEVFADVFIRNIFPGTPILIGKKLLKKTSISGVLVNNKVANVCVPTGEDDAYKIINKLKELNGQLSADFFYTSTGVIGWRLPVKDITAALPQMISGLEFGSIYNVAAGIMTTDSFPKIRSCTLGNGRILGIAKGAGMIEPNMATMLVFLFTDITIEKHVLQKLLARAVEKTFNRISIDSDQSTSDMALALSSCRKPSVNESDFYSALYSVCRDLSEDIVRNGEGTGHVIKVTVKNAPDVKSAVGAGKAVINSPLVKTAIFGNDPNVGRIIMAVGDYFGNNDVFINRKQVSISFFGENVFSNGCFYLDLEKEEKLKNNLKETELDSVKKGYPEHDRTVNIIIDLGMGEDQADVLGSDLSYEYIKENADYRT